MNKQANNKIKMKFYFDFPNENKFSVTKVTKKRKYKQSYLFVLRGSN